MQPTEEGTSHKDIDTTDTLEHLYKGIKVYSLQPQKR